MKSLSTMSRLAFAALLLGGIVSSCNTSETEATHEDTTVTTTTATNDSRDQKSISVPVTATYSDTAVSGTAAFVTESNGQVRLDLTLNIPAKAGKEVAVHLHEHGDCGDEGKNAHGHWNPTNEEHGKWGSAHFHRGDIGNVKLDEQGHGTLTMTTDLWQIGGDDSTKNILDKALIVHGGTDDYTSQPTGNAGNRIGCAVIRE